MQVMIPLIIFVLVIIFVIVLLYDKNLQIDYKNHVLKSKRLGKYVIIPFDSFLNMDRADKHYFCYENICDVYVVYHEEVVATSVCGGSEKISVIMPTKRDYKKLYKYLSVNKNSNMNNVIYNGTSDEAMNKIIEHYKEVAEKNRIESQKCIDDAVKICADIKNRK